jgi:selenocysteine lyase/cysteine desulfurase
LNKIERHERELNEALVERLTAIDNVILYGCQHQNRSGVLSFNICDQEPQSVAALLDSEFGIQVRAGLHCAPLMHQSLGTDKLGGTIRISPGIFNSLADIEVVSAAILEIFSQLV